MNLPTLSTFKDSFLFSVFGFRFKRTGEGLIDSRIVAGKTKNQKPKT
jgi:hypothetical protein